MRRTFLVVLIVAAFLLPATLAAQPIVDEPFTASTIRTNWNSGDGDWRSRGGMLFQGDTAARMARIDRAVPQSGTVEIAFDVRYEAGGLAEGRFGQYHAGFGIHVGVDSQPPRVAWGANDSYLLWLNLDTRADTVEDVPQHSGFRGQVYRSASNSRMDLTGLNVDIVEALNNAGISFSVPALNGYLDEVVPIRIRVNYDSGRVMVNDPTSPSTWFWFDVDPEVLDGNYVSLRTNSLALSFSNFTVTRL
jgi:hypothetical protein